jgi:hypothetical protein
MPYSFTPPNLKATSQGQDTHNEIKNMANHFWEKMALDTKISNDLKAFLDQGNPVDLM